MVGRRIWIWLSSECCDMMLGGASEEGDRFVWGLASHHDCGGFRLGASNDYPTRIATEAPDACLYPVQGQSLVQEAEIVVLALIGEVGPTKHPKTVFACGIVSINLKPNRSLEVKRRWIVPYNLQQPKSGTRPHSLGIFEMLFWRQRITRGLPRNHSWNLGYS